jgi:hypothetical protein
MKNSSINKSIIFTLSICTVAFDIAPYSYFHHHISYFNFSFDLPVDFSIFGGEMEAEIGDDAEDFLLRIFSSYRSKIQQYFEHMGLLLIDVVICNETESKPGGGVEPL